MTEKQKPPSFPPEKSKDIQPGDIISDYDLAMINDGAVRNAAQRIVEQTSAPASSAQETPAPAMDRYGRIIKAGAALAGTGALVFTGISGINALEDAISPPAPTVDTSIESITIHEGAPIRQEPSSSDLFENAPNDVALSGNEETVTNVYKKEGTDNGIWYGYEAHQLPITSQANDDDGIVWVNEENVTVNKQKTDLEQAEYERSRSAGLVPLGEPDDKS